jgi:hypothetical protein
MEIAVGYLAAYAWRKARRVAGRADAMVDEGLDAGMERLNVLVAARLGADPALTRLEVQAGSDLEAVTVPQRTLERVRLALLDEAEQDRDFAAAVQELVELLQTLEKQSGTQVGAVTASGDRAIGVDGGNTGIISSGDSAINVQRR